VAAAEAMPLSHCFVMSSALLDDRRGRVVVVHPDISDASRTEGIVRSGG
jgi:hypothetical protein